ncbi:MAG: branched-chain-amino-acid transaminase [Candidatus Omnitrophica bacterium]|nr:branched-chain-amino-acid transaminase [Candidatus Omnitrophota bacterium]
MKVYIDGKFFAKEEAKISVFDHGLLYGDGVFEGIRCYKRVVFKLKEHIVRLFESAHSLMLSIPLNKEQMIKAVVETIKINNMSDAYVRVVITRGEGDLGLNPNKCKQPSVIIIADKIVFYPQEVYKKGLEIITVPTVRNLPEALNPQIKSLNYLNNILAKIEANNAGYEEAIMLDSMGYVAECTGDNIFLVKNSELYTPPQCMGSLRGITRDTVLELAGKMDISVHEHVLTRHEVYISDEVFLTGTAAEIAPVAKVDGRVIGDGNPGKITLRLIEEFRKIVCKEGVLVD